MTKLTPQDEIEIREQVDTLGFAIFGSYRMLGRAYGVTGATIRRIVGRAPHVTNEDRERTARRIEWLK